MADYRNLIQFARRNNISEVHQPGRHRHPVAQALCRIRGLPGKVQRINLKIAPDLGEPDLSLGTGTSAA